MSGIDIPWLYVGQKFSTFCWHYEDLMLYSINYSHWGKPKLWYGVPLADREKFEKVAKSKVALLFKEDPNILMDIVTMIKPTHFANSGVRVRKTLQMPGEYIMTFPGSYHAGFSTGLNIGEACNFMSKSWLKHGVACQDIYRKTREKIGVFPMEWIVTQNILAIDKTGLDLETKRALVEEFKIMLRNEKGYRQDMEEKFEQARKGNYEATLMPNRQQVSEDAHQCFYCTDFCYLSMIRCS